MKKENKEFSNLERMIKKDKSFRQFFTFREGKAVVNWEGVEREKGRSLYYPTIMGYLIGCNRLTFQEYGNYGLIASGVEASPIFNSSRLFFTTEEDARSFRCTVFRNAVYPVKVIKYE